MRNRLCLLALTVVALVVWPGVRGLGYGQPAARSPNPTPQEIETAKKNAVDLRLLLRGKRLQDGLHHVHTDGSGTRLSVRVANGRVAEWVAVDAGGSRVPTELYTSTIRKPRERQKGAMAGPVSPGGTVVECLVCTTRMVVIAGMHIPVVTCSHVPCPGEPPWGGGESVR